MPYLTDLTVEKLKAHLNITTSNDDALLADKLDAAKHWVGGYTGIYMSYDGVGDGFIDPPVIEAILKLAADLYQNRETSLVGVTAQSLPFGVLDLLSDYRGWCA